MLKLLVSAKMPPLHVSNFMFQQILMLLILDFFFKIKKVIAKKKR